MKKIISLALFSLVCWMMFPLITEAQKKVSVLGDSYSTFKGYVTPERNKVWYTGKPRTANDVQKVEQMWWARFIEENRYELCVNNSFSGSTICNTGYDKSDYSDRSFVTRLTNLGNPDIIFVFGGTNDDWAESPLGEYKYADWTKEDLFNYRPAVAYMLVNLQKYYPDAQIYFLMNDGLSEELTRSSIEICKYYDVDCIELKGILKEKRHPTIEGMNQICNQIQKYISKK